MKVRLTEDMLRLRLDQSDVDALSSSDGSVGFTLPFADGVLRCALRMDAAADTLSASFGADTIAVTLPADQATRWLTSDAVSLEGRIDAGDDASTRILVEKDLGCRHPNDGSDAASSPQMFDHLRDKSGVESSTESA